MANEINFRWDLSFAKGVFADSVSRSLQMDMATGRGGCPGYLRVGTTEEEVDLSDLTTPGLMWIENLDTTNFVEWGTVGEEIAGTSTIFIPYGMVLAGESFPVRLPSGGRPLYVKADTSPCDVVLRVYDS